MNPFVTYYLKLFNIIYTNIKQLNIIRYEKRSVVQLSSSNFPDSSTQHLNKINTLTNKI